MTLERENLGYLAGMIDADGHIGWRGGPYQAPDIGVTNTSEALMAWLRDKAGGSVALQRATCPADCPLEEPGHFHRKTPIYKWHLTGYRACIVLRAVAPYLVVKADRARGAVKRYEEALAVMERPARRRHHMEKEAAAMSLLGWPIDKEDR